MTVTQSDIARTTISFPAPMLQELKIAAIKAGMTLSDYVVALVSDQLKRKREKGQAA